MTGGVKSSTVRAPGADDVSARSYEQEPGLRRFTISTLVGSFIGGLIFAWVLFDLFSEKFLFLRQEANDNFYDVQARAILHGHLWLSEVTLGVEGFKHDGHYYTYFGILPSLLRIPFILADPGLSGRLTAPFMFGALVITVLFSAMLLWRVRILVRGTAPLGRAEAFSYGALMTVIAGGSVLVLLASTPWVYNEDLIWSVAATLGSLFALLGILERPSWGRVLLAGALIFAANLDRLPTAYACVGGGILVAAWLALGRGGEDHRRLAILLLALTAVGLAASFAVNWLKFGVPFGLPLWDQVWTHVNAHRREYLRVIGGSGFSIRFLPTTLWTYLQPFGIRVQTVFPYVTLPATPPEVLGLGNPFFEQIYRTASIPASMPLQFLLACWGTVASFLPGASQKAKLLRIPLVAGAAAFGATLFWGYMAPRYEADLIPFLVLGSAAGTVHLWRIAGERSRPRAQIAVAASAGPAGTAAPSERIGKVNRLREHVLLPTLVVGVIVVLGLWSIVANFGIAAPPAPGIYDATQAMAYVSAQQTLSKLTGDPLKAYVMRGSRLPYFEPAGRLFVLNNCSPSDGGLYVSTGETFRYKPVQQEQHDTWVPVERGSQLLHLFEYTVNGFSGTNVREPLVSLGSDTIFIQAAKDDRHVLFGIEGPGFRTTYGPAAKVALGDSYGIAVDTDPALHAYSVVTHAIGGNYGTFGPIPASGPLVVHSFAAKDGPTSPPIKTVYTPQPAPNMQLCRSVLADASPR
ncbi:MAG: hypothetical protein ACRDV4_00515 [Acidimicrobiales bacterium]